MFLRKAKAIVVYDPHPHVSMFREIAGYVNIVVDEEIDEEDNSDYLKSLDPKNWKTNDHYAVLNLKRKRFRASDQEIRRQYRKIVLLHHPDKRRARGEDIKDISHDYFACISQAFDFLGNASKRLAYDSVDPLGVDKSIPTKTEVILDFFGCMNKAFLECARWSKRQPVPFIGHSQTPLEHVLRFYDFWDAYETIKDFSFLDEEDKQNGEDRETRRYMDRQNRAERTKRRQEEHKRVRQVVELAREHDPRLLAAARAAKETKERRKQERLQAIQRRQKDAEERAHAEATAAEAARAASLERRRLGAEQQRRERDQAKALAKRERKRLRGLCTDQYDHFIEQAIAIDPSLDPTAVKVKTLQDMDLLFQALSSLQLSEFTAKLCNATNPAESFNYWNEEIIRVRKEAEAPALRKEMKQTTMNGDASSSSKWTFEMTQVLIKSVNLFPAGTLKRWEVVAAYVNQHVNGISITGKEALKQAKNLRNDNESMKHETNSKAFDSFTNSTKHSDATNSVTITDQIEAESIRPWTLVEQRALEKALRNNPTSPGGPTVDRWQRIADDVGTRTRRECILRFKDLAEQVRLKKAAMQAAGVSTKKQ